MLLNTGMMTIITVGVIFGVCVMPFDLQNNVRERENQEYNRIKAISMQRKRWPPEQESPIESPTHPRMKHPTRSNVPPLSKDMIDTIRRLLRKIDKRPYGNQGFFWRNRRVKVRKNDKRPCCNGGNPPPGR